MQRDIKWQHIFMSNHCIITRNQYLVKIKLTENPLCTICKTENESMEHHFWDCINVQNCLHDIDN